VEDIKEVLGTRWKCRLFVGCKHQEEGKYSGERQRESDSVNVLKGRG
jgi:hypothetical protein